MSAVALPNDPAFYASIAAGIKTRRANDPWDGPNGSARLNQLPPDGSWQTWLIMAGRGFGKTRSGAEWIRKRVQHGVARRIVIAGPTAADIRDIMIEGESGLEAVCERAGVRMVYNPSKRRVTFANGALAVLVSADEPKRFRGLQSDTFWADELASWRYPDAWDQLQLGHRLGNDPQGIVTTTPRPIPIIKDLLKDPDTVVTRGNTFENAANLAQRYLDQITRRYEGTTLGRQELYAEILDDVEGALWSRSLIQHVKPDEVPDLVKIAVGVDPATTYGEKSDETGIAVAGIDRDGMVYVLEGLGLRVSPAEWAHKALLFHDGHKANWIVAESNQGGEMVRSTILHAVKPGTMRPKIDLLHVSRGKQVRAEPVVALYEQGRVKHVGVFASLEDQMCSFPVSTDHDDQVDALVHAITAVAPTKSRGFWSA
ncbi:MAG TPA: phage terminase large subunit [Thermomicrobiales bacterium]|nr:phage terminase large subunit [Thermomicrobiales bacterium]